MEGSIQAYAADLYRRANLRLTATRQKRSNPNLAAIEHVPLMRIQTENQQQRAAASQLIQLVASRGEQDPAVQALYARVLSRDDESA